MGYNPIKAIQRAATPIKIPNPVQLPQAIASGAATVLGKNNDITKHLDQAATGTQDFANAASAAGKGDWAGVRKNIAAGAADGPSPGPVLNPGDKTSKTGAGAGGSPYTAMAVSAAPDRGTYQSYQNPDGTLKTPLSAANNLGSLGYNTSNAAAATAFNANNAGPSTAYTVNGATPSSASTAAAGKAQNYLTDRATQAGPSAWLNLQLQNQDLAKSNALGNATSANAGANAAARSSLATKGGLSSGAAERIAKTGNQDLALQRQAILNQDQQSRLGLGAQDEATKTGLLGQASSLESGLSQFNAGQAQQNSQYNLGQTNALNQFNAGQYQQNSQYNTGQANALNQFNAAANNQNAQYNASNTQQNNQFNAGSANSAKDLAYQTKAQAQQFDIGNALNEGAAKRADDLAYYQEQMKDRAAGINANAIGAAGANSGKKLGG